MSDFTPYPLTFEPILIDKVWGGETLRRFGKIIPQGRVIGESWEVADLPLSIPHGRSVLNGGPDEGSTLRDLIDRHCEQLLGDASPTAEGGFPLLIKLLDAHENLSVQVHPDLTYTSTHPGTHLKSEAWIVLDAEPGAMIYKGLVSGTTPEDLRKAITDGRVPSCLHAVEAVKGQVHYLPSGTCHALGAGVLVAEVQTPSDTTFRIDDWGRTGREMHVEEALHCIDFTSPPPVTTPDPLVTASGFGRQRLVETEFFTVHRIIADEEVSVPVVTGNLPVVLMQTIGQATLNTPPPRPVTPLERGSTVVIPAALDCCVLAMTSGSETLEITLPPPTSGMIA